MTTNWPLEGRAGPFEDTGFMVRLKRWVTQAWKDLEEVTVRRGNTDWQKQKEVGGRSDRTNLDKPTEPLTFPTMPGQSPLSL